MKSANVRPLIHPGGEERAPPGATFYASKDHSAGMPVTLVMHMEDGRTARYLMEGAIPDYVAKAALWTGGVYGVIGVIMGFISTVVAVPSLFQ